MTLWRGWANYKIITWTGVGVVVNPGTFNIQSWSPNSDFSATHIIAGLTMYTNLVVVGDHNVPNGGKIDITFSNVDI